MKKIILVLATVVLGTGRIYGMLLLVALGSATNSSAQLLADIYGKNSEPNGSWHESVNWWTGAVPDENSKAYLRGDNLDAGVHVINLSEPAVVGRINFTGEINGGVAYTIGGAGGALTVNAPAVTNPDYQTLIEARDLVAVNQTIAADLVLVSSSHSDDEHIRTRAGDGGLVFSGTVSQSESSLGIGIVLGNGDVEFAGTIDGSSKVWKIRSDGGTGIVRISGTASGSGVLIINPGAEVLLSQSETNSSALGFSALFLRGGELLLGNDEQISDDLAVNFNDASEGTLSLDGHSETVSGFVFGDETCTGTLDMGDGGILHLANQSDTAVWGALRVLNWGGGDHIYVDGGSFSTSQLASVTFDGWSSGAVVDDGELVPAAQSLTDKINVDSRLPAYLNMDTAVMVFERNSSEETFSIIMSFEEQDSGIVPAAPMSVVLSGPSLRSEQQIDISSWPDGEYKVYISTQGSSEDPIVRGIRKQTLTPLSAPEATEVIAVDGRKMFFVDDWYFEKTSGLNRKLNPAELIPVEIWKTNPEYKFPKNKINDFWFDQSGNLNVNVQASTRTDVPASDYWVRSRDLETWEIISSPLPQSGDCSIIRMGTPSSALPDDTVYRYYDPAIDGEVDLSQVRIRYSGYGEDIMWGDIPVPRRSRIALWERPDEDVLILGDPITTDNHLFAADEIGDWEDSNDNWGDIHLSPDGKTLSFQQTRLIPRFDPFLVHYDNNTAERILVTWSTTNGVDWNPTFFDTPTLEDPWSTQHYGVDRWTEENDHLQFAYLRIFDCQLQKIYTDLVYSRDGIAWDRIKNNRPFIETGPRGTFNHGMTMLYNSSNNDSWMRMTWDGYYYEPVNWSMNTPHFMFLMVWGHDDLSFVTPDFYSSWLGGRMLGEDGLENSPIMEDYSSLEDLCEVTKESMLTPVFLRYRLDGWISALPQERRAQITTKILQADGGLKINAKTEADGFVMVEVLDRYGNELDAYCRGNAAFFKGDEIHGSFSWSDGAVSELPDSSFKLRMTLEKAEVFTLEF